MRNVQRTESCGATGASEVAREESCRSNEMQRGAGRLKDATQVVFNSKPVEFFANGGETGTLLFCEVAQQILFAQQPGLQDFCTGESETMQVRAET